VSLSEMDKILIRSVWDEYKRYSATALREMTHKEKPWLEARGSLGPAEPSAAEITNETLRAYFLPQLKERTYQSDSRIKPAAWEKAHAAMESGQVQTTKEILRELRGRHPGADPKADFQS
jgi:hypothetical protein